jgi:hypothetical protein
MAAGEELGKTHLALSAAVMLLLLLLLVLVQA